MLGSAGVIGNPMGFARSLGLGIRDFLSVPARNLNQVYRDLVAQVLPSIIVFSSTICFYRVLLDLSEVWPKEQLVY